MDMDDERGAIKTGYQADIIATKRNPLDDFSALEQVIFVMKAGIVYKGPGASAD
jgi:imidazolonepropionase-like amidohydrolase